MKRHLLPDAALAAIILCLLAFSHASPIPLERLVTRENSPSLAVSTSLSIRDDSVIASRANEGESSMTQDLLKHGGDTESTRRPSPPQLPSTRRARFVLPPLRPKRSHPKTQAVVAVIETHAKTEIPETLTGKQADLVLQVLDSTTAPNQLPWHTQEPYRWSSQTKQNLIQFYGHGLPSNPQDKKALDATMGDLWDMILAARGPPIEEVAIDNRARERLLEGNIDPGGRETRSSLLARAVEEGNEPWKTATNWEAAEREEKWGGQVWKWTEADLKKILAYASVCKQDKQRRDLRGQINKMWNNVVAMNFEEFKRTIESVWEGYLKEKKRRAYNDAIYRNECKLKKAGLEGLVNYLLPERKQIEG